MQRAVIATGAMFLVSLALCSPAWAGSMERRAVYTDTLSPISLRGRPRRLEPGMVVIGPRGGRVGLIRQTNERDDGQPAVELLVNGTPITVKASKFRLSRHGEEAIISMTGSAIRTAAILNAD
jgi:hypothetical protein